MSNNLEKLMNEKRKKGKLQQQQIANKVGVTNVTLCQAQSGQKKLSREKLERLKGSGLRQNLCSFHIFDFFMKIDIIKKIKLRGNNNGFFI